MNRSELNSIIKDKFGTVANFCRCTNPLSAESSYKDIINFLNRPKPREVETKKMQIRIDKLLNVVQSTEVISECSGSVITAAEKADIYLKIHSKYPDIISFCTENERWSYSFVNNIVSNNGRVRLKSPKFKEFIEFVDKL